jgi:hypothetical protein
MAHERFDDTVTGELFDPEDLKIEVLSSAAGYYIGQLEPCGAPFSRLSGYFKKLKEAEQALAKGWGLRGNLENEALIKSLDRNGKLKVSTVH